MSVFGIIHANKVLDLILNLIERLFLNNQLEKMHLWQQCSRLWGLVRDEYVRE